MGTSMPSQQFNEAKARVLAQQCGVRIVKLRDAISFNNTGGFMLIDIQSTQPFAGHLFEWTAQDVIDYCLDYLIEPNKVHWSHGVSTCMLSCRRPPGSAGKPKKF